MPNPECALRLLDGAQTMAQCSMVNSRTARPPSLVCDFVVLRMAAGFFPLFVLLRETS